MKKFKFRLQRVLEFRDRIKKGKQRELSMKQGELNQAEQRVDQILSTQDSSATPGEELLSMAELKLAGEYQESLRDALVEQRLLVIEAANAVEEARDAYLEKAVEAEMLESLKRKRLEEHKEEVRKAERKDTDEMSILRHRFRANPLTKGEDNE